MRALRNIPLAAAASILFATFLSAQTADPAARVQQLLAANCLSCHGSAKLSGLDLRQRETALKGGSRGPSIKPGDARGSLLYQAISQSGALKMPPGRPPLPPQDLEVVARWIDSGAVWLKIESRPEPAWWSFRRPIRPPVPAVKSTNWVANPVDAFILARLEEKGLKPAPPADRRTLARRLYFDLLGLPPTPEQVEAFLADRSPQAYEKLVDQLLASPHYGERWGRHWLDVVRYADTGGYQTDLYYKDAWRYRDYVIHAFNSDKPYDRFVQEQVAGDEIWPDNLDLQGSYFLNKSKMDHMEARIATGLYTISPIYHESGLDVENYFDMQWTDWVDTTGAAFLGLTVGCARCHDHKFDPISQKDYYGLRAIFAGSDRTEIPLVHRMDLFDQWQFYPKQVRAQQLRYEVEKIDEAGRKAVISDMRGKFDREALQAFDVPNEKRTEDQRKLAVRIETAISQIKATDIEAKLSPGERDRRAQLVNEIGRVYLETLKPAAAAMVLGHTETIPEVHILNRGDYHNKGSLVAPSLPAAISSEQDAIVEPVGVHFTPERRKALALWLTRPDNPLTARVMVNRIWQGHFGRGIVGTPNDFGRQGELPTHPELLDWLAVEFMQNGWSVKKLHRLILLSNTYQMSGQFDGENARIDPRNLMLWRMTPRRLQAEEIWDSVHAVAGTLTTKTNPMRFLRKSAQPDIGLLNPIGGPPAFPALSPDEMEGGDLLDKSQWPASPDLEDQNRRAVYIYVKRSFPYPVLNAFDAPDGALSCGRRQSTTVAPQSLALMNSQTMQAQSRAFATLLLRDSPDNPQRWIEVAWKRALGRSPDREEFEKSIRLLETLEQSGSTGSTRWLPSNLGDVPAARADALAKFCLAVLNLNEFLYVD